VGALTRQAASLPSMVGQNLAKVVSVKAPYVWEQPPGARMPVRFRVAAYDYGIKFNILRSLARLGVQVHVVPYDYPAGRILADRFDGVFLSNGPGDPEPVSEAIANVKALLGHVPIFGICLGHQILGIALGGETYKLKFGHHGANHPVQQLDTGAVEITSQNHGFAVREETLPQDVRITHRSLNDRCVEGMESTRFPAYSVQYHPEASPGPHDASYLFDRFLKMLEARK
jgi:carbamoyl-phosphate synthase small subunit